MDVHIDNRISAKRTHLYELLFPYYFQLRMNDVPTYSPLRGRPIKSEINVKASVQIMIWRT